MAYQTGTLNNLADIQTVIRVFLTDNGWTWDSGASTIHKDAVFVRFIAPTTDKVLFVATTALSGGADAPRALRRRLRRRAQPRARGDRAGARR